MNYDKGLEALGGQGALAQQVAGMRPEMKHELAPLIGLALTVNPTHLTTSIVPHFHCHGSSLFLFGHAKHSPLKHHLSMSLT